MTPGYSLIDAVNLPPGEGIHVEGGRISAPNDPALPGFRRIKLNGDRLLPGFINAHDHLHLNHYPRTRYRRHHENVSEWIGDIDSRRHSDPVLRACGEIPRAKQLLHGGLKNLLSGATTVAHHDPHYDALRAADFPVRIAQPQGWSHSLFIDGADKVRASCEATPPTQPWIIHAGEGVDATASGEFAALESLGCLRANAVFVHGVAFDREQLQRLALTGAAIVWCPASNDFLFSTTFDARALLATRLVALGSDSRLSGSRDLLEEMNLACRLASMDDSRCIRMVTGDAAGILRLPDRGSFGAGNLADFCVLPAGISMAQVTRADLRAVVIGGRFRYGDEDYRNAFQAAEGTREISVDGRRKWLDRALVERAIELGIEEPGVEWQAARNAPYAPRAAGSRS